MKVFTGRVQSAAVAALAVLVAFGVDLNEVQHAALLGAVAAILPFGEYLRNR